MKDLIVKNLCYSYTNRTQKNEVLKDINVCFYPRKMYAVTGKSGSGKTTLLSLLGGLDSPASGEILYDGEDIFKIDTDLYRLNHVSMIYQNFNLMPLLTAAENVMLPLTMRGMPYKEAVKIAEQKMLDVGLDEKFFGRYPSMLSGGEQQRIAIARTLATEAKIILADEPTGNLDAGNSSNIINLLKELVHTLHCCAIIVTHDNAVAEQADEVFQLKDGELVVD